MGRSVPTSAIVLSDDANVLNRGSVTAGVNNRCLP